MQLLRIFFGCCFLTFIVADQNEPIFELPLQLIGFPVIIASVRIVTFLKKLGYALSPDTYVSRVKRAPHLICGEEEILNVDKVEKILTAELGSNFCIHKNICIKYAEQRKSNGIIDWIKIFSELTSNWKIENYVSSILGSLGSSKLCHLLAKRRPCDTKLKT